MNLKKAVNVSHFFMCNLFAQKSLKIKEKKIPKEKMKHSLSNLVNKIEEFIAINHFNLSITTLFTNFYYFTFFFIFSLLVRYLLHSLHRK